MKKLYLIIICIIYQFLNEWIDLSYELITQTESYITNLTEDKYEAKISNYAMKIQNLLVCLRLIKIETNYFDYDSIVK